MKLFLASSCTSATHKACWKAAGATRFLFSFANGRAQFKENRELYDNENNEVIVDSGAFSAWTRGVAIDLKEYARFCCMVYELSKARMLFVNLDVIPGREGRTPTRGEREESALRGWENYMFMRQLGLPVMHVFHQHEDLAWLRKLIQVARADGTVAGISPANDVPVISRYGWLLRVVQVLYECKNDEGLPRTHGFGVTSPRLLELFPFFQCDSASWLASSLYGTVAVRSGRGITTLTRGEALARAGLGPIGREAAKNLVPSTLGYAHTTVQSLRGYLDLEQYATELWSGRGVTFA